MILALDCATKTGWALIKEGRVYESGVQDFSKKRGESNGAMFLRFQSWLRSVWSMGISSVDAIEREKLAWAAGFFDGEGNTGCRKAYSKDYIRQDGTTSNYESSNITMQVSQVDRNNLEKFHDCVGGIGSIEGPYKDKRENSSPIYMWRASGIKNVQTITEALWPWLGESKRKQAEGSLGVKISGMKRYHTIENRGNLIVYELAHHRGGAATEICVNLTGRVQEFAALYGIEYATVHSGTLKKWACGSGKADKGQMMTRAVAILGREPEDDNEADAALMGAWAWEEYGKTVAGIN
jgi:hypothetical protein